METLELVLWSVGFVGFSSYSIILLLEGDLMASAIVALISIALVVVIPDI